MQSTEILQSVFRWIHVVAGILWIGLLYFFNFVNGPFAGTMDGVYRSTDSGATFRRANFPDKGVQIWSFMIDPQNPKRMLAGGSPVSARSWSSTKTCPNWGFVPAPITCSALSTTTSSSVSGMTP